MFETKENLASQGQMTTKVNSPEICLSSRNNRETDSF